MHIRKRMLNKSVSTKKQKQRIPYHVFYITSIHRNNTNIKQQKIQLPGTVLLQSTWELKTIEIEIENIFYRKKKIKN